MAKTILLVDDDKDLVYALNVRLQSRGYLVAVASDGPSAISAAGEHQPDLIVLDIVLPRADGFFVLSELKAKIGAALPPVIVLSAMDIMGTRSKALEAGASAYFQKPVITRNFLGIIEKAISDSPTHHSASAHRLGPHGRMV